MTAGELKRSHESNHPNSYFFRPSSMKFAEDTMGNFGCRDAGDNWALHRKKATLLPKGSGYLFNKVTFKKVARF